MSVLLRSKSSIKKRKIGTMFSGSISDLIKNDALQSQRSLLDIHSCTSTVALNVLQFADSVVLFHSPNGCMDEAFNLAYSSAKVRGVEVKSMSDYDLRNIRICSTNLTDNEVIFGGEQKLKKAIFEAKKRYDPAMICVVAGCVSEIIGDNIDSVCEEAEEEFGHSTYVLPFHLNGFQSHSWMHYSDIIWSTLVNRVMKKQDEIDPELVNFFRPQSMSTEDINEIEKLIGAIGLRANIFPDYQSVEFLENAPAAVLNIGLCKGFQQPIFEAMYKKFNTPYIDALFPLGIEFTKMWLREIGEKVNKEEEVEGLIEAEMKRITPELERLRSKLKGKNVIVTANHAKTVGFAHACNDLGMNVQSMVTHASEAVLNPEYEMLKDRLGDININVGSPVYEEISIFNKFKPDIVLGHWEITSVANQLGFATKNTYNYFNQKAHIGFEGLVVLGRSILNALTNPLREKILKYYRNDTGFNWKESPFYKNPDPFQFVNGCQMHGSQKKCDHKGNGDHKCL